MLREHIPQILLVEDQPFHYNTLRRRLKKAGYGVTVATDYATARKYLETAYFHLSVLDICLNKTAGKNEDGLRLLEDIERLGLRGIMPTIILTAYSTEDRVLRAREELGATNYIRKETGYVAKLLDKINTILNREVGSNFAIRYEGSSVQHIENCVRDIDAAETDQPAPELLIPQTFGLMGKLFAGAQSVFVQPMPKGLSGSAILRVQPTYPSGLAQWLIVRIGRRDKIKIEEDHYRAYVERFLPTSHTTQLTAQYTQHLGGMLYTLQNLDVGQTHDFGEFYAKRPAGQVISALNNLFFQTCSVWYDNPSARRYVNLRDLYLEAFELQDQPERIPDELAALRPNGDWEAETLRLDPPGVTLPNPVRWWRDDDAGLMPVSQCITHGDLRASNILMDDGGGCWLIDFYRTHPSHILQDVVKLEVDIKFNLLDPQTAESFAEMEQLLAAMSDPADGISISNNQSPATHKAAQVIVGLRTIAWRLLGGDVTTSSRGELQYEYLFSLLMATLNLLRLRAYKESPRLQPYREYALLSAGLICQRLEELSKLRKHNHSAN